MSFLTSEVAAQKVGSIYDLILIASRRARELNRGWSPMVAGDNSTVVTALREIEEGKIGRDHLLKRQNLDRKEKPPEAEIES
jgi:DNA-directed RNA polymerase subunit omega